MGGIVWGILVSSFCWADFSGWIFLGGFGCADLGMRFFV